MIRFRFVPFTLTVAVFALVGCGEKSASELIGSAKSHLVRRDPAAAVVDLKSALQEVPQNSEARYLLGVALLSQRDFSAAAVELGKAAEAGHPEEEVAPKLARALLSSGKFKEVIQTFGKTFPSSPAALAELRTAVAVAQMRAGKLDEAAVDVEEALRAVAGYPWALLTKARLEASGGRVDSALEYTKRAIVPGELNGEAQLLRGLLLWVGKRDGAQALEALRAAAVDPEFALEARGSSIEVLLRLNKVPEAKIVLADLKKSHPRSRVTHFLDAVIAYTESRFEAAEQTAEQLLKATPDNPQILVLAGAANLKRGALLAAEAKLGRVVQTVERSGAARQLLAETYLKLGQPEKALATLGAIMNGADGNTLALAGQAYLQMKQPREAEERFIAAAKLRPDDVNVQTAIALTEFAKGNVASAVGALQGLSSRDPSETADLALISVYMRRNDLDGALAAIEALKKKQPGKPGPVQLKGIALLGRGDLAGARAAFEEALKLEPLYASAVTALATLDLQAGKPDAARSRLETAIKATPKNAMLRMALVDVLVKQRAEPKLILAAIDDAISADPLHAEARVAKIVQLSEMRQVKEAAAAGQQALATLPSNALVLDAAGRALANAGDDQQAISAFTRLAAITPRSAQAFLRIADVYAKKGELTAVSATLGRAVDVEPESPVVHRRLLDHAQRTKDYRAVIAVAKDMQRRRPRSAVGYLLEGDAESARKGWPAAVSAYKVALTKPDADARAPRRVQATLRAAGDIAGAERFSHDWLKEHPRDVMFLEFLAGEALLRKELADAERLFKEVIAVQPKNAAALNNLAWILTDSGRGGGVALAEQALSVAPGTPAILDTLAHALGREGRYDLAIERQKQAIAAAPDRPHYRLSLARWHEKAGQRELALAELKALAALGDKFPLQPDVDAAKRRLETAAASR